MDARQIALVQKTFESVEPIAQEVGELFYTRLFEMDPGVRPLFKGDMKKQALMLMTVIGLAVRGLDRPEAIESSVRALGQRHFRYGVSAPDYNTFGAALIWADIVKLETEVAVDNADVGRLGYMTNAKVRGALKTTAKVAGTDSRMIWDDDGILNGYTPWVTNQVRGDITKGGSTDLSAVFFGNWADLLIGQWGTLDIIADPYTGATAGTVRVIALQDVDIAVRHPESFARIADADV